MNIDNYQLTISDALEEIQKVSKLHSDTPSLDAQVMLAHILQQPRTWVLAHPESQLSSEQHETLSQSLSLIGAGVPLPYILGHWEFYGLDFIVSPAVLIPRPETELLIEEALKWLKHKIEPRRSQEERNILSSQPSRHCGESAPNLHVADIGTGSGCIAVTLAKLIPNLRVTAIDINDEALDIAHTNALKHAVEDRIDFKISDIFAELEIHPSKFDVICANLPYIPTRTLHSLEVYGREPTLALDGGPDGLNIVRRLLEDAPQYLAPAGLLLLEIDASQGISALRLAQEAFPSATVNLLPDLVGHDRLIHVET